VATGFVNESARFWVGIDCEVDEDADVSHVSASLLQSLYRAHLGDGTAELILAAAGRAGS
jgi:hypothetical protein